MELNKNTGCISCPLTLEILFYFKREVAMEICMSEDLKMNAILNHINKKHHKANTIIKYLYIDNGAISQCHSGSG